MKMPLVLLSASLEAEKVRGISLSPLNLKAGIMADDKTADDLSEPVVGPDGNLNAAGRGKMCRECCYASGSIIS